jgi:hypothetical protein
VKVEMHAIEMHPESLTRLRRGAMALRQAERRGLDGTQDAVSEAQERPADVNGAGGAEEASEGEGGVSAIGVGCARSTQPQPAAMPCSRCSACPRCRRQGRCRVRPTVFARRSAAPPARARPVNSVARALVK